MFPTVVLVVALGCALLAPMGLNVGMRRSQYQVAQLQQRMDDLVAERSTLKAEQASLSSTQRVKDTADRLGMVTPAEIGFIDLAGSAGSTQPTLAASAAASAGDRVGDGHVVASTSQET
ncbi:MAG TPA: hypothetical protein VFD74_02805, partial [Thermoleophilia bacterium]|nr:hypothetical protein [Thermoleophilia bacterium]